MPLKERGGNQPACDQPQVALDSTLSINQSNIPKNSSFRRRSVFAKTSRVRVLCMLLTTPSFRQSVAVTPRPRSSHLHFSASLHNHPSSRGPPAVPEEHPNHIETEILDSKSSIVDIHITNEMFNARRIGLPVVAVTFWTLPSTIPRLLPTLLSMTRSGHEYTIDDLDPFYSTSPNPNPPNPPPASGGGTSAGGEVSGINTIAPRAVSQSARYPCNNDTEKRNTPYDRANGPSIPLR
ncbi:hypothetical protein BGZ63DRAFT_438560 [Mariannaea sp. PMI_226]|nr:hypothetical protein BGZ63DRAFT_438560 [Mariannaea sp. PMI_226]